MRPIFYSLTLAAFLLAACTTATPEPLSTAVPATPTVFPTSTSPPPSTPAPQRATLLRIAVLGETTTTNVWALFDQPGADYWNTATQAGYWPTLYNLAPPSSRPQPATALGELSPLICDAIECTAIVTLKPDLTWTDGSPFTAADVAFTVNTALQFRLGLNWQVVYNPDVLDHAEALDSITVKFYFKTRPTVADWQYGVLFGPIVNRAYWQPRIANAVSLLPDEMLLPTILELEDELAEMQAKVDALNLSLYTMAPTSTVYEETSRAAKKLQEELNGIYNKLQKNRSEYETKLFQARAVLFELAITDEPTLGPWKFSGRMEGQYENQVVLGTPFGDPWFDRVRYITYPSELAAVNALQNADVDILLSPDGLSSDSVLQLAGSPQITLSRNITRSARFLAFNHDNPFLIDPILHQALACMLDPQGLTEVLEGAAAPLSGFVLDAFWWNKEAYLPCSGVSSDARLAQAVRLLKNAGYTWDQEPGVNAGGSGLTHPEGIVIPALSLLAPAQDDLRVMAADYIAQRAKILGLTIDVQLRSADDMLYMVYGPRNYDMALLGWRLSAYPSYLCDWFQPWEGNPFVYSGSEPVRSEDEGLWSACEAWAQSSDLEIAKRQAFEVQSILMRDLPLIPLYASVRVDAYRNIRYPFSEAVDGLGGLYGAPELAIPIP